ncbi:hypothetical protein RB594_009278 [Gaeumannomyces avenae]
MKQITDPWGLPGSTSVAGWTKVTASWSWVLGAFALLAVIARVRDYLRLRHIRGPWLASWTDFWLIRSQYGGRMNLDLDEVCRKYGKVVRVAPNWVMCADAEEIRKVWAVRSQWRRGVWYRGLRLDPRRDSTFTTVDEQLHAALRSKLTPGYSGKDVDNVHQLIDEQVASFVGLLESKYLSSDSSGTGDDDDAGRPAVYRPVDIARKVQYLTLDIISSLAFGKPLGNLAADADALGYIHTMESNMVIMMTLALCPHIFLPLQSRLLSWMVPNARGMAGIGDVMGLAHEAVADRFANHKAGAPPPRRDMLSSFVAHGLGREDCEGEAVTQIVAGSDTSATAIRSTLLLVMATPAAYGRLQAEIDAAARAGRLSSPATDAEARALPYLQAVVREGIRMFPPATGLLPKVSDADEVVAGVRVPAGTNVAWAPWPIMHDRAVFGEDADMFRPERWIEAGPERWRLMDQTVMMDFKTSSRYECLGKTIALIELNKTYVELFRRFDLAIVDPTNPWKSFNAAFFIQSDLNVKITRRKTPV